MTMKNYIGSKQKINFNIILDMLLIEKFALRLMSIMMIMFMDLFIQMSLKIQ